MSHDALTPALALAEQVDERFLLANNVLPLSLDGSVLIIAVTEEPKDELLEQLRLLFGAEATRTVPASKHQIHDAVHQVFGESLTIKEGTAALSLAAELSETADDPLADARDLAMQPPVIRYVNLLIRDAYRAGASDIHLESTEDGVRLRLRIDGVLEEAERPPSELERAIVSRIKLLAKLDITERRRPQDGRIRMRLDEGDLDMRLASVPTAYGESLAIRLLRRPTKANTMADLGMSSALTDDLQRIMGRQHGVVIATGPTGSGKTTTLYALLGLRDAVSEKLITVEDPIEYHLPHVSQVPVDTRTGVTFSTALRSILRQDPDVVMVGEMRDAETAQIAVQAAMTGHLVLSTLHTNDAISAFARLIDLGIPHYMIAASVEGILAQRLVRRICTQCIGPSLPSESAARALDLQASDRTRVMRGFGCRHCRGSGFSGRMGIHELFLIDDDVRRTLAAGSDLETLRRQTHDRGWQDMRSDARAKVLSGWTTAEEVLRVLGS